MKGLTGEDELVSEMEELSMSSVFVRAVLTVFVEQLSSDLLFAEAGERNASSEVLPCVASESLLTFSSLWSSGEVDRRSSPHDLAA